MRGLLLFLAAAVVAKAAGVKDGSPERTLQALPASAQSAVTTKQTTALAGANDLKTSAEPAKGSVVPVTLMSDKEVTIRTTKTTKESPAEIREGQEAPVKTTVKATSTSSSSSAGKAQPKFEEVVSKAGAATSGAAASSSSSSEGQEAPVKATVKATSTSSSSSAGKAQPKFEELVSTKAGSKSLSVDSATVTTPLENPRAAPLRSTPATTQKVTFADLVPKQIASQVSKVADKARDTIAVLEKAAATQKQKAVTFTEVVAPAKTTTTATAASRRLSAAAGGMKRLRGEKGMLRKGSAGFDESEAAATFSSPPPEQVESQPQAQAQAQPQPHVVQPAAPVTVAVSEPQHSAVVSETLESSAAVAAAVPETASSQAQQVASNSGDFFTVVTVHNVKVPLVSLGLGGALLVGLIVAYCALFGKKAVRKAVSAAQYSKVATSADSARDDWDDEWAEEKQQQQQPQQSAASEGMNSTPSRNLGIPSVSPGAREAASSSAKSKQSRGTSRDSLGHSSSSGSDTDLFAAIGIEAKPKFRSP